jgi:phosphoglycerate dehydrogenase-like enzyme
MPAKPLVLLDPYPRPRDLIFDAATIVRLESFAQVVWHDGSAPADTAHIDRWLPEAWALIGQSALPAARLARAERLQVVANVESNFMPNIDYDECFRRRIHVIATGPVFARPVAEMALGLALAAARRIPQADAAIRNGTETLYGTGDNHDSILLGGRPLALIGCGNLGRALLPLLRGFGGRILVHDPWIHPSVLREMGVEPASLEECFATAACVFILAATTTDNAGAIGRPLFERMMPGGIVILVSRAGVVDFEALLDCAASGRIRAAIDVWPEEPIPPGYRGRNVPNTVVQAHRAGNIPEIWPEMGRMVVDDLELILKGLPPQCCQRAVPETVQRFRSKPVG